jgi:hypothetical protein
MADTGEERSVFILHVILHQIIVLRVVRRTTYLYVQLVSLFGPIPRDTGMEVGVLMQEVHFLLKTEPFNGLLSLREEFQGVSEIYYKEWIQESAFHVTFSATWMVRGVADKSLAF